MKAYAEDIEPVETSEARTPHHGAILRGVYRRHKLLAIGVFLCLAIPSVAGVYLTANPLYESTATILLQPGPIIQLPNAAEQLNTDTITSALTLLKSRSVAEDVLQALPKESVDELLAHPEYVEYLTALKNRVDAWRGKPAPVLSPQQQALNELTNARVRFTEDMRVGGPRSFSVLVTINGRASTPRVARDLVNGYLQVLVHRMRGADQEEARKTREFLDKQAQQAKANLLNAQKALTQFEEKRGRVQVGKQTELDLTRLSQAESALTEVQASRAVVDARIRDLRATLEQTRPAEPTAAAGKGKGKPGEIAQGPDALVKVNRFQAAQEQLAKREERLNGLRQRYTEAHPLVQSTEEDVAAARAQVVQLARELPGTLPADTVEARPVPAREMDRMDSVRQLATLQSEAVGLETKAKALEIQVAQLRESVRRLSRDGLEYSNLRRAVDAQQELVAVLSDKLVGATIREQRDTGGLRIIDSASLPLAPTRSKMHMYALAALLLSGALAVGVAFALEWRRQPVETDSEVVAATGFAVLGSVGRIKGRRRGYKPLYLPRDASDDLEAYRGIRASIETERLRSEFRSILVTSPGPSVGKSTTVLNLAQVLHEFGRRVLIVEADLRRPSLYRAVAVTETPGLREFLHGDATIEQVCRTLPSGLTLIPSAGTREDAGSALQKARIEKLLAVVSTQFDVVLVDSAPLLVVSDTRLLLPAMDRVVLVVRAGQTTTRELRQAQDLLRRADARVLGVVVNEAHPRDMHYYTRQYAKYYRVADEKPAALPPAEKKI